MLNRSYSDRGGDRGGVVYAAYLPYAGEFLPDIKNLPASEITVDLFELTKQVSSKEQPMVFASIPQWGDMLSRIGWEFVRISARKMYNEALDDVVITYRGVAISEDGECVVILFLKRSMIV